MEKSDISQLVSEALNGAFCVSYAKSSLTCKFELTSDILHFDGIELSKKSDFSLLGPETSNGAFSVS